MDETISLLPSEVPTVKFHGYLLGAVAPRPIAFASTVDGSGRPNLSPFSYFNVFSANPPVMIFSPARRVRDKTTKHTLANVRETGEVVINIIDHAMVQQASLASAEYPEGTNEFLKAGFSMVESDVVRPFRVGESPVQFECRVYKVEALGQDGGAGNLIFSEVLKIHIKKKVLDESGAIDPFKMDQVARLGGNWYTRARSGLFEVPKPLATPGVGVDQIPGRIRNSKLLSGNDLGMLGNAESIPSRDEVKKFVGDHMEIRALISAGEEALLYRKAQEYLSNNDVLSAWKVLLANE